MGDIGGIRRTREAPLAVCRVGDASGVEVVTGDSGYVWNIEPMDSADDSKVFGLSNW